MDFKSTGLYNAAQSGKHLGFESASTSSAPEQTWEPLMLYATKLYLGAFTPDRHLKVGHNRVGNLLFLARSP